MDNFNLQTNTETKRFAHQGMAYSATRFVQDISVKIQRGGDFYSRSAR